MSDTKEAQTCRLCGDMPIHVCSLCGAQPAKFMQLRDWFAGQALAASMADFHHHKAEATPQSVAGWAYDIADAMLAARTKGEGK
jgi:hypothetical protein